MVRNLLRLSAVCSDRLIVSSFHRQSQAWQALRLSCCLHALTCIPTMNACLGKRRMNIPQTWCAHKLVFASRDEELKVKRCRCGYGNENEWHAWKMEKQHPPRQSLCHIYHDLYTDRVNLSLLCREVKYSYDSWSKIQTSFSRIYANSAHFMRYELFTQPCFERRIMPQSTGQWCRKYSDPLAKVATKQCQSTPHKSESHIQNLI